MKIIVVCFIGCLSVIAGSNAQQNTQQKKDSIYIEMDSVPFSKEWSNVIIKFEEKIYVKLLVQAFSKDSIVVYTNFINDSDMPFYLYKPLLPDKNLLKESVFNFLVGDENKINSDIHWIDSSEGDYYAGTRKNMPCVIPVLKPDNFLLLKSKDSLRFTINVANFYTIKPGVEKGNKKVSVAYSAAFPFVNKAYMQLFEMDRRKGKKKKPVFYNIGPKKADKTDKYLYQRAYFTIN